VLLCDDVTTNGFTFDAARLMLREAGAEAIMNLDARPIPRHAA